jgi:hypothetical protein
MLPRQRKKRCQLILSHEDSLLTYHDNLMSLPIWHMQDNFTIFVYIISRNKLLNETRVVYKCCRLNTNFVWRNNETHYFLGRFERIIFTKQFHITKQSIPPYAPTNLLRKGESQVKMMTLF